MRQSAPYPLTDADRAAWFDWQVNRNRDWALWGALERWSFPADRRDAELLLRGQIPCLECQAREWHTFEIADGEPLLGDLYWFRCHVCGNIKASHGE